MNAKNLLLCTLLTLSSSIYAAEATQTQTNEKTSVSQDIANSTSIDDLIEKMNKAKQQDKYKYMNAIKAKISSSKKDKREEEIKNVLAKIHEQRSEAQGKMQEAQDSRMSEEKSIGSRAKENMGNMGEAMGDAGSMGGSNDGMGGMGGDGMGGGSGGGMGGGSGGGMGGGSGNGGGSF